MTEFYVHPAQPTHDNTFAFDDPSSQAEHKLNPLPPSTFGLDDDLPGQAGGSGRGDSPSGSEDNGNGNNGSDPDYGADPLDPEHFPTEEVFQGIMDDYLNNLSERKREKALISQQMYDNVLLILQDPRNTATSTAQFRFWAKKMFQLLEYKGEHVVTHDKRPVAVKEQIYDVLVYCHGQASHGGRDKTSSMTREYYSWVPKQLVAEFVKKCPTCLLNRQKHPNFFGEGHPPVIVPRESRHPSRSDPPPAGVPQTVTLQDAREAAKAGVIPKATGFFSKHDDDEYSYPGSKKKPVTSKSKAKSKNGGRQPGQPIRRESSNAGAGPSNGGDEIGRPFDELEQHQQLLQQQQQFSAQAAQAILDWSPSSIPMGNYDSNGNPASRPNSTTSTLDSPALATPNFYPLPGHNGNTNPYLSSPGEQRGSVPELYGQPGASSSCNDFDVARRGSTGGMLGGPGGDGSNMDPHATMMAMMRAHQMQSGIDVAGAGGSYFGAQGQQQQSNAFDTNNNNNGQQQSFNSFEHHHNGLGFHNPSPSRSSNDPLPTFNEPFLPSSTSAGDIPTSSPSTSILHRANRPPPLNLTQQFQAYRSNLPLDSAALDPSGGLLSAHQQSHPYMFSPSGLSPTSNAGSLALPLGQGQQFDAGGMVPPGSADFRNLGQQVQQLHVMEGQDGQGAGEMQFSFDGEDKGNGGEGEGAVEHGEQDELEGQGEAEGKDGEGEKVAA